MKKILCSILCLVLVLTMIPMVAGGAFAETSDYLCFTAEQINSTVILNQYGSPGAISLKYSTDNQQTWKNYSIGDTITLTKIDDKVYFKSSDTKSYFSTGDAHYYYFEMTGRIAASGNVMSLLDPTCQSTKIPCEYCFSQLFKECSVLTSAPKLPATTLNKHCYNYMFYGCTSLTTAPKLPARTLADSCYNYMFWKCTSLTNAPKLPATTLANSCYKGMFSECTSLTVAPELPATTLASYCYSGMFSSCKSLEIATELPATTLADYCYQSMFSSCKSLEIAPKLPAMTLANNCYWCMFAWCDKLTTAPKLPATILKNSCYYQMFDSCTSLTTAPELPATTLEKYCYDTMFRKCSNLKTVYIAATNTSADNSKDMFTDANNVKIVVPQGNTFDFGGGKNITSIDKDTYKSTVRFFVDGNEYSSCLNIGFFEYADEPETPEKVGYDFLNWSTEQGTNKYFEFTTPIVTDTNLYAWFEHTHVWNYTTSPDATSLTVSCVNDCDILSEPISITLDAPNAEYTGVAYSQATLTNYEQFHDVTDATETDITYYLEDGVTHTKEANSGAAGSGKAPVKAGRYVASASINTIIGTIALVKRFCIEEWNYTTTTDFTLKATLGSRVSTVSLNALDTEYTGAAYNIATLTNYEQFHNDTEATKTDITYYLEGGITPTNASNSDAAVEYGAPVKVGKYVAKVTINTAKGSFDLKKQFEIKAKPSQEEPSEKEPSQPSTPSTPGFYYIPTVDNTKKTDEKIKEIEEKTALKESIAATEISMKSKQTILNGKMAIKIIWTIEGGNLKLTDLDNFEIFRSTKKNSGYGKTPYFTSSKPDYGYYVNSKGLKKGKTYYFKVRGYKVIDGEKYYTPWSTKCWRTVK